MVLSDPSEGADGIAKGGGLLSLSDSEGVLGDKLASTERTESTPGDSIFSSMEMVSERERERERVIITIQHAYTYKIESIRIGPKKSCK